MLPSAQKGVQLLEETPSEAAFRRANNFSTTESELDQVCSYLHRRRSKTPSPSPSPTGESPPPAQKQSKLSEGLLELRKKLPSAAGQIVDNVGSYFGHANPIAQAARPSKDSVWLFDNVAYRPIHPYPHSRQPWHAVFVAGFFSRDSGKDAGAVVAWIADKVGLHAMDLDDEEGKRRIAERVAPFLTQLKPGRFLDVVLEAPGLDPVHRLGPGGRTAVTEEVVGPLYEFHDGHVAAVKAVRDGLTPHGPMLTFYIGEEGWTVISDIDDTIKITMTASPVGILRTTFVETPQTTKNMPSFYTHIRTTLQANFFYLSASPYNLYPFLRSFIHANYPHGPILLRDASWITPAGLLQTLTQGVQAYKVSRMDKIHEQLPRRKVVCVGDSTQSDPEAYAEIYHKYPGWVRHIFIRKVLGLEGMEVKNSDKRFADAFKDVPPEAYTVFEDPVDLNPIIDKLRDAQ